MSGRVFLVGAGPGDPKLLTLRGVECLRQAEVVIYDRLAAPELLEHAPASAERIFVGKGAGQHTMSQEQINELLVDRAQAGRMVVRLKGGDPYVFGRGGEEALFLAQACVAFEVVPGITSAIAGLSYAGIPVTHRGIATSFAVITGHEDPAKPDSAIDWARLARGADTLVFLMGIEHLNEIVGHLRASGRPARQPAAAVRWATTSRQEAVFGSLGDIVERVREAELGPPALVVVGDVVRLHEQLDWRAKLPLSGLRVLVTRARDQSSQLAARLAELGAVAIEYPTIEIRAADDGGAFEAALARLSEFAWVVFTSANGVDAVFDRLATRGADARAFGSAQVCAIGPSTAASLLTRGIIADWIPEEFISSAILQGFRAHDLRGAHVLLARADIAPAKLADALREQGAEVADVAAYRTAPAEESRTRLIEALEAGEVDIITLTSSSTVRNLMSAIGARRDLLRGVNIACIGPVTAATAEELGLTPDVIAQEHTVPGLIRALEGWAVQARSDKAAEPITAEARS